MIAENEVFEKVRECIVEALEVEADEVMPSTNLFEDLGAESLDLLDIVFRLEKVFTIKLPRSGIYQEILAAEGVKEEDILVDGALTALGAEKLKEKMPGVDRQKIYTGFLVDDLPTLFTVQTFITMVKQELQKKQRTGE